MTWLIMILYGIGIYEIQATSIIVDHRKEIMLGSIVINLTFLAGIIELRNG